jgi:hypothetical protein
MKHSQKMILIPENNLDNYLRQQRLTTPPTVAKMAQLDGQMTTVLDGNDTSQDEKAKLYSQILENYLRFKGKRNVEVTKPVPIAFAGDAGKNAAASVPSTREVISKEQSVASIVGILPKTLQSKTKMILEKIKDNPQVLSWNEKGELKYQGETVPNTNITNLVSDSLRHRKNNKPNGFELFTKGLKQINLPEDLVRNPERLQLFKTYGYEQNQAEGQKMKLRGKKGQKRNLHSG